MSTDCSQLTIFRLVNIKYSTDGSRKKAHWIKAHRKQAHRKKRTRKKSPVEKWALGKKPSRKKVQIQFY